MNNYTVFDTACGSLNVGDQIIMDSFIKEMKFILDTGFVANFPTHVPVFHFYQANKFNHTYRYINSSKYKFVAGTNILCKNLLQPWPNWNINIFNCSPYKNCILVGCGSGRGDKINLYSKLIYKKILNKQYFHSVRDEKTKVELEKLGVQAINTGCVTTWGLTESVCSKIKKDKSDAVIFTLTDYKKDEEKDKKFIDILRKNYKTLYFWVQGSNDLEYFNMLVNEEKENFKIVPPSLQAYQDVLKNEKVDYVGTRLHAGIFAMKNLVRSIIIAVDNRAIDMSKDYNLNCITRENIVEQLEEKINSKFTTEININIENINKWKSQFK